jgi:protoheme IX farnesyltransferase
VLVVASGFAPVLLGFAGALYLGVSAAIGLCFIVQSVRVARETNTQSEPQARRLFGVSILYLFAIFAALLVEQVAALPSLASPLSLG